MTNAQKVKHSIAVLKALNDRFMANENPSVVTLLENLTSLSKLLGVEHKPDSKVNKKPSEEAKTLCRRLLNQILARKRNYRAPDIQKWASDMEKILRLDNRTPEQVADVIDWCQHDEFWQDNILSPAKLRKQLDKLELHMSKDRKWQADQKLRRPTGEKTAKERYMEKLNAENSGDDG